MATYIKDLKEDNGDITRPVTEAGAVLLSGGGDLETTLASKADQTAVNGKIGIGDVQSTDIVANAVTTAKIADGAVTTAKIADNSITAVKLFNNSVSTDKVRDGAVTAAKLGLTSSTLPSIAWDSGTVAGSSGLEGLVYADLVLINNAYIARSQTAWNANWQNIGTLPTGYRPKTQTIFPAIFTNINTGNVTGYGRVRFNTSGVIDAKANATVSNAYCCFSGVFVTV